MEDEELSHAVALADLRLGPVEKLVAGTNDANILEWDVQHSEIPLPITSDEVGKVRTLYAYHRVVRGLVVGASLRSVGPMHPPYSPIAVPARSASHHPLDPNFFVEEVEKEKKRELRKREAAEAKAKHEKIYVAAELPPELRNLPILKNGGPNKKDLMRRRSANFGDMLYTMGVWKSRDGIISDITTNGAIDERANIMRNPWFTRVPAYGSMKNPLVVCRMDAIASRARHCYPSSWIPLRLANFKSKICVIEFAEQNPIFRNPAGTSSVLVRMVREGDDRGDALRLGELGVPLELADGEPSPLMMEPEVGDTVTFLYNRFMNLPLFYQDVPSCDFILFPSSGEITKMSTLFLSGQVEPHDQVMPPKEYTKGDTVAVQQYIELIILWELLRVPTLILPADEIIERFRPVEPAIIENVMRRYADISPDGRVWTSKRTREDLREIIQNLSLFHGTVPCEWDAMECGIRRLREAGITKLAEVDIRDLLNAYQLRVRLIRLAYHGSRIPGVQDNLLASRKREIDSMKYVSREMMRTPWYMAFCFDKLFRNIEETYNPFPSGTVMKVYGYGDPSGGRGDMVNFLPDYEHAHIPSKEEEERAKEDEERRKLKAKGKKGDPAPSSSSSSSGNGTGADGDLGEEEEISLDEQVYDEEFRPPPVTRKKMNTKFTANTKTKYEGTVNDLRILSKEQLNNILMEVGIPKDEVLKIDRWDCTWLIEQIASSFQGKHILDGSLAKYSRLHKIEDADISEEVKIRWKIENSKEFTRARERCTSAFHKFASFATGKRNTWKGGRFANNTPESAGGDAAERQLRYAESERKKYEAFIDALEREMLADVRKEREKKKLDEETLIMEWAANQGPGTGRKMLTRTIIRRQDDGRESIWVEYILDQDTIADRIAERDEKRQGYWDRENAVNVDGGEWIIEEEEFDM